MPEKRVQNKDNLQRGLAFAYRVGDYFENRLGSMIEKTPIGAPVLEGEMDAFTWYRIPIKDGISGDGSEYYIYAKKGRSKNLIIFFSGGGVAWNEYTAARPTTYGRVTAGMPNYYYNNLRPFTQIMNIHIGITEVTNPRNLFRDWNVVVITYATGDFHVGNNDFEFINADGNKDVLHFHGYKNFRNAMEAARKLFDNPESLLIAGDSAGAFAVPALAGEVYEDFYSGCQNVILLSDSGQLLYDDWYRTAKEIWKCKDDIADAIKGDNITVCWYKKLYEKYGDRFNYLYATSTHDYLLSAYYNDIANKIYASDSDVQEEFFLQMKKMLSELRNINPKFSFYINNFKNKMVMKSGMHGGTTHTNVRSVNFHLGNIDGISMERWLYDACNRNLYDAGMSLLDKRF